MAGRCETCGREEYMPFVCKLCKGRHCVEHRLPENHACANLDDYKRRTGPDGRLYASPHEGPGVELRQAAWQRKESPSGAAKASLFSRLEGKVTFVLLGIMAVTLVLQLIVGATAPSLFRTLFVLGPDLLLRPWSLLTSVFSHAGFNHFFANGLVLFFFGPTLESLIGSKRFLGLFLATGVLAGIAEVFLFGTALGLTTNVLGASGAIMGMLGTLTVLAPRLTVLVFFVIPAPLWLITGVYALVDILFLGSGDSVARVAHLAGLAVGLAYGKHLRDLGLRVRTENPMQRYRRYL